MAETDLTTLIRAMSPRLHPDVFVFATVETVPPGTQPLMRFHEAEGLTLILKREDAAGLDCSFPCRMITLEIQSSLEAVGFLATITKALAGAGIPVNPVSAFHHDHLFVPEGRAEEAMAILLALASRS